MRSGVAISSQRLLDGAVYSAQAQLRTSLDDIVGDITQGCCAVVFEDERCAVCFELRSQQIQRGISEPTMEKSLKGGKDSFTETLRTDTALVRKRIANPALKIKSTVIGRKSMTQAAILYVDGIADPAVVSELRRRIDNINVDGALSTGIIEEYIADRPRSMFPQLVHTERPDRFARQLLNGRVGLIIDGIPIAFLVPVSFPEFLRVPQEDSQNYVVSSALSVIRWAAVILALALPAFYTAIAMYHQEMIPTQLLLSVIASKQDVPFSTALELIGMLVAFELLQEAGLRLPDPIGDTVSIIGALIVGQSAVEAKVISPIAVIVVATAGIAGYAQPSQDLGAALRICRFALVIAAIAAGLFGVVISLCLFVWYLCTIDSFGRNYTAPWSGGRRKKSQPDVSAAAASRGENARAGAEHARQKEAGMRKLIAILCALGVAVLSAGCSGGSIYSNYRDIAELMIVQTLGFDSMPDGGMTVSVSAEGSYGAGSEDGSKKPERLSASAASLTEAQDELQHYSGGLQLFSATRRISCSARRC